MPPDEQLYQVDVGYFCAGVVVQGDRVVVAAPILRWAIGKSLAHLQRWVAGKRGTVVRVRAEPC